MIRNSYHIIYKQFMSSYNFEYHCADSDRIMQLIICPWAFWCACTHNVHTYINAEVLIMCKSHYLYLYKYMNVSIYCLWTCVYVCMYVYMYIYTLLHPCCIFLSQAWNTRQSKREHELLETVENQIMSGNYFSSRSKKETRFKTSFAAVFGWTYS